MNEFEYVSRADGWKIHAYRWELQPNRGVVARTARFGENLRRLRGRGLAFSIAAMSSRARTIKSAP